MNINRLSIKEKISIKIAIIYAVFSALWILFSDQILLFLVRNPERITAIQTIKGWVFILASAFKEKRPLDLPPITTSSTIYQLTGR